MVRRSAYRPLNCGRNRMKEAVRPMMTGGAHQCVMVGVIVCLGDDQFLLGAASQRPGTAGAAGRGQRAPAVPGRRIGGVAGGGADVGTRTPKEGPRGDEKMSYVRGAI